MVGFDNNLDPNSEKLCEHRAWCCRMQAIYTTLKFHI